ncbi:MAG: DUF4112 domain-containing protein [Bacteroidales bacterium]|jgi:hypothetical protein|nr:DUF4112 domain-containing protein [Bacteroidales bacterium]
MESKRRQRAREELGFELQTEIAKAKEAKALAKEERRREKKELAREKLEGDFSYRTVKGISFLMDKCFADAILGFVAPGVGDFLTSVLTLPFLYVSVFKVKSLPLTLALLYNMMLDCFIGLTPYLGDVLDIFHRSYAKNYRLIVGFVEDDQDIIAEVRRSAWKSAIMIVVLGVACYFVYQLVKGLYMSIAAMCGCN